MKALNTSQLFGLGLIAAGLAASILSELNVIRSISGATIAVGLGFLFKWISLRKQNVN